MGLQTDIFHIEVPESAREGDVVTIEAAVQNIWSSALYVTVTGKVNGVEIHFGGEVKYMDVGGIGTFYQSFVMPAHDVAIDVWTFTKLSPGMAWGEFDDHATAAITLEPGGPLPELSGEIVSISTSPPSGLKLGDRFRLLVTGKNTSSETVLLGVNYIVYKPSGDSVIDLYDELPPGTGANDNHNFVEPPIYEFGILIDEVGRWTVLVGLRANGEPVDQQDVELFTIVAPPADEYPTSAIQITDFTPTKGDYRIGDSLTYTGSYKYQGKPQAGSLVISIGTGIFPSFISKYDYSAELLDLEGSMDWKEGTFEGSIVLPDILDVEQTYSMRAVIETADGVRDEEKEYTIFTIVPAEGNGVVPGIARIEGEVLIGLYAGVAVGVPSAIGEPPMAGVTVGNQFQIGIVGTNLASGPVQLGMRYTITRPNGTTISDTLYQIGATASGSQHSFAEPMLMTMVVDVEGEWLYKVELLGLDHLVGDIREGVLFPAVVKKEIPGIGTIGDMGELIGMLVLVMMMQMMMGLMEDPRGFRVAAGEKIEKVKEVAAPVIQIFTAAKGIGK